MFRIVHSRIRWTSIQIGFWAIKRDAKDMGDMSSSPCESKIGHSAWEELAESLDMVDAIVGVICIAEKLANPESSLNNECFERC